MDPVRASIGSFWGSFKGTGTFKGFYRDLEFRVCGFRG